MSVVECTEMIESLYLYEGVESVEGESDDNVEIETDDNVEVETVNCRISLNETINFDNLKYWSTAGYIPNEEADKEANEEVNEQFNHLKYLETSKGLKWFVIPKTGDFAIITTLSYAFLRLGKDCIYLSKGSYTLLLSPSILMYTNITLQTDYYFKVTYYMFNSDMYYISLFQKTGNREYIQNAANAISYSVISGVLQNVYSNINGQKLIYNEGFLRKINSSTDIVSKIKVNYRPNYSIEMISPNNRILPYTEMKRETIIAMLNYLKNIGIISYNFA